MRRLSRVLLIAIAGAGVFGCNDGVEVLDDLDFEVFVSQLHTPYVVGAEVNIGFRREDGGSVGGWGFWTRDEQVLQCNEQKPSTNTESIWHECHAIGPGETEIVIRDSSDSVRATRTIKVEQPDTILLIPAGRQRIQHDQTPVLRQEDPLLVLVGGTTTFEVEYRKDDHRLFGNGALTVYTDSDSLFAKNRRTYMFQNREWLSLSCLEPEAASVSLQVSKSSLGRLDLVPVGPGDIEQVIIEAEDTNGAEDGQHLYLLARAFDVDGHEIFAVDFDWDVDGTAETGEGDLFSYKYHDGTYANVSASAGPASDEIRIEMSGGWVTTSNNIGCATAAGSPSLAVLLSLLMAMGGLVFGKRYRI